MLNFHGVESPPWLRVLAWIAAFLRPRHTANSPNRINELDPNELSSEQMRDIGLLDDRALRRERGSAALEAARDVFMRRPL